ncbi:uncharacterized protein LOC105009820 isoform X2 [Esox lucius]|uniref:uncharacterized protein LOC105009820 isoform X2 n=1 Tax=Esox lucius TaxID=8010 RepID=UPI0014771594|nr:uncharacterized protein LOC105009820 isoform X2 [Esox lucius]
MGGLYQWSEVEGDDLNPTDQSQDLDEHVEQQVSSVKGHGETNRLEEAAPESAGPSYSQQADQNLASLSSAQNTPQTSTHNLSLLAQRRPSCLGTTSTNTQWSFLTESVRGMLSAAVVNAPDHSTGGDLPRTPSLSSSSSWFSIGSDVMEPASTSSSGSFVFENDHVPDGDYRWTPTPSPSLSSEEEDDDNPRGHPIVPENGDGVDWNRPLLDRWLSVFGLSQIYIFSQVHRDARRCLSELIIPSFQRKNNEMRTNSLSADTRLIMAIVEVIVQQIECRLTQLALNGDASWGPEALLITSRQFAEQLLGSVTATLNGHCQRYMAINRLSGKTVINVKSSLDPALGPLACLVILETITSIQWVLNEYQANYEAASNSNYMYFLAAVVAEVESMLFQRPGPHTSPRQSNSDLLDQARANITRNVKMKLAEMTQLRSQQNTSMSSDLVDLLNNDTQDKHEYLDYQSPSCSTGIEDLDIDVMAREMVQKATNKLKESMSEFDLEGESTTSQVSSGTFNYSNLSHSNSDLGILCVQSTEAVRTVQQIAKTELDSHSDESFDASQTTMNHLACLAAGVESTDNLEIGELLHVTPRNIAEESTHILKSLLLDLNKAVEENRTEGNRFLEQAKSSLQTLYRTAVDQLSKIFTGGNHTDEQDQQEVPTNNDPTLAVSQESVRCKAKQILSNVLNVIEAGVTVSEHSSVDEQLINECQVATEILDSILNKLRDDEFNKEDRVHELSVSDTCQDVSPKTTQVYMVVSSQDMLKDDVSTVTSVDDTVPRPESLLQGMGTHRSYTSQGSRDLDKELMSKLRVNRPDTTLPIRCSLTASADDETCHISSRRKKKSQGWSFGCCLRLPTVRTKVFKNRVEPEVLPVLNELPSQPFGLAQVALDHDHGIPFCPKPEEDLPTEPAQKSQKRPLLVRAFRAICKAMSKPFRGCAFRKNY